VIVGKDNQIEECCLFSLIDTVYASTLDAWDLWLNEKDGRIGAFEFKLDYKDLIYTRMSSWGDDELDWIPPVTFTETNDHVKTIHQAMQYGRWLNEEHKIAEYLHVSSDSSENTEAIYIYVGIDLSPAEVLPYF